MTVQEKLAAFREAKLARREAKKQQFFPLIREALGAPCASTAEATRTAAQRWNLSEDEVASGMLVNQYSHPGHAALMVVRQALGEFNLPGKPDLRYGGMKRVSGHGPSAIDEGVIVIDATVTSVSGPKHHLEIPVPVVAGRALQPSILIENGMKRVLTQNTFDEIFRRGTFTAPVPDRKNMYARPEDTSDATRPRERVPKVHGSMFAVPTRRRIADAIRGYSVTAGDVIDGPWGKKPAEPEQPSGPTTEPQDLDMIVKPAVVQIWNEELGDYQQSIEWTVYRLMGENLSHINSFPKRESAVELATRLGQRNAATAWIQDDGRWIALGRSTQASYPPGVNVGDLSEPQGENAASITPGQTVRTKRDVIIGDRGGNEYILPRGTRGRVIRDVDLTQHAFLVSWDEVGYQCVVGREDLVSGPSTHRVANEQTMNREVARMKAAIEKMARGQRHFIVDLFDAFDLTREQMTAALKDLASRGVVALLQLDAPWEITDRIAKHSISVSGVPKHIFYVR